MQNAITEKEIPADAEYTVALMGNTRTRDFALVDLTEPVPATLHEELRSRKLVFLGCTCIVRGAPHTSFDGPVDTDTDTVTALARLYLDHLRSKMRAAFEVATLQALYGSKTGGFDA